MSATHRLTKVEAALTPKQLVLRWLEEAQRYPDMGSYIDSLIDGPSSAWPMDRLVREARESARIRSRGAPRTEVDKVVRRSMTEAAFLFLLVLGINVETQNVLDREGLIYAALTARVALLANVPDAPLEGSPLSRLVQARDLLRVRVAELRAFETARSRVEQRYLDGAAAVFRAARESWTWQRERTEGAADLAVRLVELDGADAPVEVDPASFETRVARLAADLVEPAKAKACNELGDGRKGHAIATAWLSDWVRATSGEAVVGLGPTL